MSSVQFLPSSSVAHYSTSTSPLSSHNPLSKKRRRPAASDGGSFNSGMKPPGGAARDNAPRAGGQFQNNEPDGDANSNPRGSWRPYQGRWKPKPKMTARGEPDQSVASSTPDNAAPHKPRRNRARHNPRTLNPKKSSHSHPGGSLPIHTGPSQPFGSQNNQNFESNVNNIMNGANLNQFPMFPGDAFNGTAFQQPFFPQDTPQGQQQSQLQPSSGQFAANPFAFPPMPDFNNPGSFLPFMPPAPLMNFGLLNPAMANPMFNGFPFFPVDPMATVAAGPAGGNNPQGITGHLSVESPKRASRSPEPRAPPSPKKEYLMQSSLPPKELPSGRPLLVILDLNGTLIFRKHRRLPPVFAKRDGLVHFLDTLMKNHKVMIWSSSQPETVDAVCEKLFPGDKRKALVAEWGRDKFGLTKSQYKSKIQVYKTLETVWGNRDIQASYPIPSIPKGPKKSKKGGPQVKSQWDQTNTILIDDSKLKALSEPYNILDIPEFTNAPGIDESTIFPRVLERLAILAKHDDVSKMLQLWNSKLSGNGGILDLDLSIPSTAPQQTEGPGPAAPIDLASATIDLAQARKERRKARKQEKKAARRAATAAITLTPATGEVVNESLPVTINASANTKQNTAAAPGVPLPQTQPQPKPPRSPSPASSVQSENYLLDRLEESLNTKQN